MSLLVIDDVEPLLVRFFQAQPELAADLGDRIYTALPAKPVWPAARVVRWGGWAVINHPFVLDEGDCQVDIWGGPKAQASRLARVMRALVDQRFVAQTFDVVSYTRLGMLVDSPDSTYEPARPHFRFDLTVRLHPSRAGRPGPL